jgi:hypothetical protein
MLLDWARREPVIIEKQGRQVAVILSLEEYQRLSNSTNKMSNLDDHCCETDLSLEQRSQIFKLPPDQRAKILSESAEAMLSHYENDTQWQELSGGDFIEY